MAETIIDGEIAVLTSDGAPDFDALQARLGRSPITAKSAAITSPATFVAFDVLWHNGSDLRGQPHSQRLKILESLDLSGSITRVDSLPGKAAEVIEFAKEHQLEGATVKQADSLYRAGRFTAWLKFRSAAHSDCGSPHGYPAVRAS